MKTTMSLAERVERVDAAWKMFISALKAGDPRAAQYKAEWEKLS